MKTPERIQPLVDVGAVMREMEIARREAEDERSRFQH